jgi:alanyl-tRNA synthetase
MIFITPCAGQVACRVDYKRRSEVAPNHSMTHVLNLALRAVLGPDVEQRGSLCDEARLRFDFSCKVPAHARTHTHTQTHTNTNTNTNTHARARVRPHTCGACLGTVALAAGLLCLSRVFVRALRVPGQAL